MLGSPALLHPPDVHDDCDVAKNWVSSDFQKKPTLFIRRLLRIMCEEPRVVCFRHKCVIIHNPSRMIDLLPTYFPLKTYDSFRRRLNKHNFKRDRGYDHRAKYCTLRQSLAQCKPLVYKFCGPPGSLVVALARFEIFGSSCVSGISKLLGGVESDDAEEERLCKHAKAWSSDKPPRERQGVRAAPPTGRNWATVLLSADLSNESGAQT